MLAYCAIHAAWVWPPLRFAVPVIPLLLWLAFIGAAKQRLLAVICSHGALRCRRISTVDDRCAGTREGHGVAGCRH